MINFHWTHSFFILFATIISGCSTIQHAYEGPEQPKEELAFVTGFNEQSWGKMRGLYIVGINDKPFLHLNEYPYAVYLKPGTYDLTIRYWNASGNTSLGSTQGQLITVEKSHTYTIKHETNYRLGPKPVVKIWIEDESGQIISTTKEPSVQPTTYGWTELR